MHCEYSLTMSNLMKHTGAGICSGAVMGGIAGIAEYGLFLLDYGFHMIGRAEMLQVLVAHSLHWGLAIGLFGAVRGLLSRKDRSSLGRLLLEYLLIALIGSLFLYLLFKLNTAWCVETTGTESMIWDCVLVVAAGTLVWVICRVPFKIHPRLCSISFPAAACLWLCLLVSAILFPASGKGDSAEDTGTGSRPNVLLVTVDTLRADHLGCYGYDRPTSPAIDTLADDGITFSHCIAASSWTRPSTVSLLTGMFPPTHNQNELTSVLPPRTRMLPDAASEAGYRTAYVAANLLVCRASGFAQDVHFYRGAGLPLTTSLAWFLMGANATLNHLFATECKEFTTTLLIAVKDLFSTHVVDPDSRSLNDAFLEFLKADPDAPFFAYLHYMDPHIPYDPDADQLERFEDPGYSGPPLISPPTSSPLGGIPPFENHEPLPEDRRRHLIDRYDAEIAGFDSSFGMLIDMLKERGLYDNTLIVFTSDHGEAFYLHKTWQHRSTLFQELIHVPLIMKLPSSRRAGTVIDGTCRHVDVVPTLLDLVGLAPWPDLQGESLARVIETGNEEWPGLWAFSDSHVKDYYLCTYIEGDRKFIQIEGPEEYQVYYDLNSDPDELSPMNGANSDAFREMRDKLHRKLDQFRGNRWETRSRELDDRDREALRALGYGG